MSNVLFLYERDMPTVSDMRYRFANMFALDPDKVSHVFKSVNDIKKNDLSWCDVLVLIRGDNYYSYKVAKRLKKASKAVVFFMDDDLFCIPKASLPSIPWKQKALRRNLELSDVFFSSSTYLINKYVSSTSGKRGVRTDSATAIEELSLDISKRKQSKIIKIVYAAGANHGDLFNNYILPILPKIEEKYSDDVSLTFFGTKPTLDREYNFEINYIPSMPLAEYRKKMIESEFDIGLAPLHDDSFSKCKYFNKFIEYTITGVVGIYSNVEPYTEVITDGENGFLANNNPNDWFNKVSEALDIKKLNKMHQNAKDYIASNFSLEKIAERLKKEIPEFYNPHKDVEVRGSLFFIKIKYKVIRLFDIMYLSLYYFKRDGLSGLRRRIAFHKKEARNYK